MAAKKLPKLSGKIKLIILFLIFTFAFFFMYFNTDGLNKYFSLKNNLKQLEQQIKDADNEISRLNLEIDSLRTSLIKIEKVAREEYMMLKPNEKVLEIDE